ncbi:unnamed protein product [Microthlaspi erraticum]|uniref:Uncharacterized protein n=1 Tax=Microthlaspi erraticum TaxID=1685480 RepID=A0A6D2HKA9_9BRAS|nr:unnamed protein product [Microthlaspi erraticum]
MKRKMRVWRRKFTLPDPSYSPEFLEKLETIDLAAASAVGQENRERPSPPLGPGKQGMTNEHSSALNMRIIGNRYIWFESSCRKGNEEKEWACVVEALEQTLFALSSPVAVTPSPFAMMARCSHGVGIKEVH